MELASGVPYRATNMLMGEVVLTGTPTDPSHALKSLTANASSAEQGELQLTCTPEVSA